MLIIWRCLWFELNFEEEIKNLKGNFFFLVSESKEYD